MGKENQTSDAAMPEIEVIKVMLNNKDVASPNKTLQLRWKTQKIGGNDGMLNMFLVGGVDMVETRVALQTMHQDHIDAYELEVGTMLNDVLPTPVRLTVEEINAVQYHEILNSDTPEAAKSYGIKQNPESGEYMLDVDGDYIYRTVKVTSLGVQDKYIAHTQSTIEAPEGVTNELVEHLQA